MTREEKIRIVENYLKANSFEELFSELETSMEAVKDSPDLLLTAKSHILAKLLSNMKSHDSEGDA